MSLNADWMGFPSSRALQALKSKPARRRTGDPIIHTQPSQASLNDSLLNTPVDPDPPIPSKPFRRATSEESHSSDLPGATSPTSDEPSVLDKSKLSEPTYGDPDQVSYLNRDFIAPRQASYQDNNPPGDAETAPNPYYGAPNPTQAYPEDTSLEEADFEGARQLLNLKNLASYQRGRPLGLDPTVAEYQPSPSFGDHPDTAAYPGDYPYSFDPTPAAYPGDNPYSFDPTLAAYSGDNPYIFNPAPAAYPGDNPYSFDPTLAAYPGDNSYSFNPPPAPYKPDYSFGFPPTPAPYSYGVAPLSTFDNPQDPDRASREVPFTTYTDSGTGRPAPQPENIPAYGAVQHHTSEPLYHPEASPNPLRSSNLEKK